VAAVCCWVALQPISGMFTGHGIRSVEGLVRFCTFDSSLSSCILCSLVLSAVWLAYRQYFYGASKQAMVLLCDIDGYLRLM
jgi:hypothetical protein